MFWQNALSDLRKKFFTYSIKPRSLPIVGWEQGNVPYESDDLELSVHSMHTHDYSGRLYQFLLSLAIAKPPICVLSRYLIFNTVTGCFHLFNFRQLRANLTNPESKQFFRFPGGPRLQRRDMLLYVHEYFRYAFQVVGTKQHWLLMKPTEVLFVMKKFWHLTGLAQDTIAICLEVQQLYLYVHLKHQLCRWHEQLPKLAGLKISPEHRNKLRDLRSHIKHGMGGAMGREYDRVFFIEVIARRLLFWSCIHEFQTLYPAEC